MLFATLLGTLDVFSANSNPEKQKYFTKKKTSLKKNLKNRVSLLKKTKKILNSKNLTMVSKQRLCYLKWTLVLGLLLGVGLYASRCCDSSLVMAEVRDIAQFNSDINVNCDEEEIQLGTRIRREISTVKSRSKRSSHHHDGPSCLDETDSLYYISKYHRKVCDATVRLGFEIFYEREPIDSEFEYWFGKCVAREVNEAYILWKFAENQEHLDVLMSKRMQKEKETNEDSDTIDEDNNLTGPQPDTPLNEDDEPVVVPLKIRMTNQEFTDDLNDPTSEGFQQKSNEYSHALLEAIGDIPGLAGVKILGFRNGSLLVFYELIFDKEIRTVEKVYENQDEKEFLDASATFDPAVFAEKVKEILKEALSNSEIQKGKLSNTILADAHVDLDSLETIPDDVVQEFVKLNPAASIVTVDLTTHHHHEKQIQSGTEESNTEEPMVDQIHTGDENDVTTITSNPTDTITSTVSFVATEAPEPELDSTIIGNNEEDHTNDPMAVPPETTTESTANDLDSVDDEQENNDQYYGIYHMDNLDDVTAPLNDVIVRATTTSFISTETITSEYDNTITNNDIFDTMTSPPTTELHTTSGTNVEASGGNPLPNINITALSQTVFVKLRVTNMNYTENLTDRQSEQFQYLEAKFVQILRPLLQSIEGFTDMEVIGFSYGSLIVNNELHFKDHAPDNVKEDVKERISAAAGYFKYAHVAVDTDTVEVLRPDEADLCEFVQCNLYADCVVRSGYRTECICRPGYVSVDPANCVSICDLEPGYCRNGGECNVAPGRGAVCRCRVQYNWGYEGERCENLMPKSVLLVSASTGVACVAFMMILVASAYCFYRKRRNAKAEKKANDLADKEFMRAAQIMSYHKMSRDPERLRRVNPMYVQEDDSPDSPSGSGFKDTTSSTCPSPSTTISSLDKSSNASTSTSSFFVREQLDCNGPLSSDIDAPERRILHLQVGTYPNHRMTWCEERDRKNKKTSSSRPKEDVAL